MMSVTWTIYSHLFILMLGLAIVYGVKKKTFNNFDVSNRTQRPLLFLIIGIFALVYLLGLFLFHAPFILVAVIIAIIFGVIVMSIINTKIKASLHVATVSSLLTVLAMIYGGYYFLLLLIIPLVAWSRVIVKRHTILETVIGGAAGCLLSSGTYAIIIRFFR